MKQLLEFINNLKTFLPSNGETFEKVAKVVVRYLKPEITKLVMSVIKELEENPQITISTSDIESRVDTTFLFTNDGQLISQRANRQRVQPRERPSRSDNPATIENESDYFEKYRVQEKQDS